MAVFAPVRARDRQRGVYTKSGFPIVNLSVCGRTAGRRPCPKHWVPKRGFFIKMAQEFHVVTASSVKLQITSTLKDFPTEKHFAKDLTIGILKSKLEMVTGSLASSMELQLFDSDGKLVVVMSNDDALLGSYPVDDGMRIHVQDSNPDKLRDEFGDVSKVEKYEISSEDYAKRGDSVLAFKKKHKMAQFKESDPEEEARQAALKKEKEELEERLAGSIEVGARCRVDVPTNPPAKLGTVMFVGKTEFKPGFWVGVKYDEPRGKNDGSVQGKRYFECQPKYGGFVKPQHLTIGDFPEEDVEMEDDEM